MSLCNDVPGVYFRSVEEKEFSFILIGFELHCGSL